jgi:hypothetical protein
MNEDKDPKKETEEDDTEGHNLFATFDYYTERHRDRQAEIERDVRKRQQEQEARNNKKRR